MKVLESCGKLARFVRPIDPVSLIPSSFAFVTYNQTVCALRAFNIIPNIVHDEETQSKFVVKAGTKESLSLNSVNKTEQEAVQTLPQGSSLEDVYGPIRKSIEQIINPPPVLAVPSGSAPEAAAAVSSGANGAAATGPEGENGLTKIDEEGKPVNYYNFITLKETGIGDERQTSTNEVGEKFLNAEIEKFRMRQQQRDK